MDFLIEKINAHLAALSGNQEALAEIEKFIVDRFADEIMASTMENITKPAPLPTKKFSRKIDSKSRKPRPRMNPRYSPARRPQNTRPLESGYIYEGSGEHTITLTMADYENLTDKLDEIYGPDRLKKYTFKIKIDD